MFGWIRKEKRKEKWRNERIGEETNRRNRERKKKKVFRFSLRSTKIGLWVFVEEKGKVSPHNEGYVWVPKSWGFVKIQEVGNFPTWIIF